MFKPGDKVILTAFGNTHEGLKRLSLKHGALTVKDVFRDNADELLHIEEARDGYYVTRFMLAQRPKNLRKWAKEQAIFNYSRLNKNQLLDCFYGKVPVKKKASKPKDLYKLVKKAWIGSLNNWAYEGLDGKVNVTTGAACYSHFYFSKDIKRMVVDVAFGLRVLPEKDHEDYKEYLRYHLNESPFSKIYITKDVNKAINHGVYIDVTQNHSQVVAALIDLRCAYEFPRSLAAFTSFRKAGMSNHVSKWLSMLFSEIRKDVFVWTPLTSHVSITPHMSKNALGQFFAKGIHRKPTDIPFNKSGDRPYQVNNSVAPTGEALQKPKEDKGFQEWGYSHSCYPLEQVKEVAKEMEELIEKGKK